MLDFVKGTGYTHYFIKNNKSNVDYFEEIIGPELSTNVTEVQLVDPFLYRTLHQLLFRRFCELLKTKCISLKFLQVYTKAESAMEVSSFNPEDGQLRGINRVCRNIFDVVFGEDRNKDMLDITIATDIHDRSLTLDSNVRFNLGRGLEMYHGWCPFRCRSTHSQRRCPTYPLDFNVKLLRSHQHEITILKFRSDELKKFWL